MYASKVKGQKLTFQVSGMLWERSLVMRDLETKSLWSHHLGRAMDGKLKGAELDVLPAVLTTWKEWQARHQGSDVLAMKRTANSFREQTLQNPKKFVYVILLGLGKVPPAVAWSELLDKKLVAFKEGEEHVLVTMSEGGAGVQSFDPTLDGRVLTFLPKEGDQMVDGETKSVWSLSTGVCATGELAGKKLTARRGMLSYRGAWRAFHPKGRLIGAAE